MAIAERTRKTLWTRAHNQCAFPGCLQPLTQDVANSSSGVSDVVIVGEEAHIRAQSVGGPRYDAGYPKESVDSYDNLVLMCSTHHTMIDANGGAGYTVRDLLKMKQDHERRQQRHSELQVTLRSYIGDRFEAENTIQFQQVDLRGPSVDSMFVDVPVGCRRDGSRSAEFLRQVAESAPGDTADLEAASGFVIAGATQVLLHPDWVGNAVLVGGPGQGKSTVLQYVCQFHRARRLGKSAYTAEQSGLKQVTSTPRFPVRVDLRKYAQWAQSKPRRTGQKNRSYRLDDATLPSLEEYIIADIQSHIGAHEFRPQDLAVLIATEPVLIALDGLDEIANLPLRARVTEEIARAHGRLTADAADLVILVATRPGSSLQPLTTTSAFPVLHLQRLTHGLRLQYLQRWVAVAGLTTESAERLQAAFMDNQHVPHINELASYPMQLAILLHLLHRRQLLPQQRTQLYADYLQTFLDREQTEDKEPLLADQRRVIEDTHAYLGWYLQMKAETGQSSGSITGKELRDLLREHLAGQVDELKLADQLYSAISSRVLCLVERDDAFEFEVQSLREYFAAVYLFDNLTAKGAGNSRDDGLNALLERPYWANVCRFYIGMLTKGEIRSLKDNLRGVERIVSPLPTIRSMAVLILSDRIFDGMPDASMRDLVDVALDGPGVVFAQDGFLGEAGTPMLLGERAGRSQAVAHLKERLEGDEANDIRAAAAASLAAHAAPDDDIADWWWHRFEPATDWLRTASALGVLGSLDPGRTAKLCSALDADQSVLDWRTALLMAGGYDGHDEAVLNAVVEDINDGAAEEIEPTVAGRDLDDLILGSYIALDGRQYGGTGHVGGIRGPESSRIASRVATGCATLLNSSFDPSSSADWQKRLSVIAETWGDGWILRRAVGQIPSAIDISEVAATARTECPTLATAAIVESAIRHHRGDSDWWRAHLESLATARDRMLGIVALLERAHPRVIVDLAALTGSILSRLTPRNYRAVELALERDVRAQRVRELALQEPLRLRQVELSGRLSWLVWIVGTESTRDRIRPKLETNLRDLFEAGIHDGREAVLAAHSKRKLKLDLFEGARRALTAGGWSSESRLATMSLPRAKSILEAPENWPADLVQVAIDRVGAHSATRTKTMADLAEQDRWFQG